MTYSFKEYGKSDKLVLILHGAGNSNSFGMISQSLMRGYRYVSLSLPGHDGVSLNGFDKVEDIVKYVVSFLKTQKYSKLSIIGFSFGGMIGSEIFRKYRKELKIDKLVCWAVPFRGWNFNMYLLYSFIKILSIFRKTLPKSFLRVFKYIGIVFTNNDEELLCRINLRELGKILLMIKKERVELVDNEDVLYIYDQRDILADFKNYLAINMKMHKSKVVNNPYGGHFGKKESWDMSLKMIKEFLK